AQPVRPVAAVGHRGDPGAGHPAVREQGRPAYQPPGVRGAAPRRGVQGHLRPGGATALPTGDRGDPGVRRRRRAGAGHDPAAAEAGDLRPEGGVRPALARPAGRQRRDRRAPVLAAGRAAVRVRPAVGAGDTADGGPGGRHRRRAARRWARTGRAAAAAAAGRRDDRRGDLPPSGLELPHHPPPDRQPAAAARRGDPLPGRPARGPPRLAVTDRPSGPDPARRSRSGPAVQTRPGGSGRHRPGPRGPPGLSGRRPSDLAPMWRVTVGKHRRPVRLRAGHERHSIAAAGGAGAAGRPSMRQDAAMDLGLKDRVYVLTGASRGLGFATARELVADGARVVISSRDKDRVAAAVNELGGPDHATGVVADLGSPDTPTRLVETARQTYGRLDGALVSVGGPPPGTAAQVSDDQWRAAFETVFLGAVRMARTVAAALTDGGAI